ncbi:MAG: RtcB family protein [Candidatus Phocaeicola faecigallinarum]|uniref:3'-phosphate/5'-hydroxy nucleic acid ligase n=1 Tax=Candidatus Phocaeicola faecigallinarum TaxID=2838732 RepID=A0A948WVP4_9BACT|nr:RtcB family protein [Candidatus Phocaeicola faecigallinarum]
MKTIEGYDVKIFTENIEDTALDQIKQLLSIDVFSDCKIRIMPDVHAGAGCVIGFTGNMGDKVIPNIVGVDIGCGMIVQPFSCCNPIDFHALNEYILSTIPSGRDFRDENYLALPQKYSELYQNAKQLILQLRCYRELKEVRRLYKSIGSLGGGNHFIELDKDESDLYYLVVHTGSRNLGKQVADIYQKLAIKCQSGWDKLIEEKNRIIAEYKLAGRKDELQDVIRNLHNSFKTRKLTIPQDLSYLQGQFREDYLHDMDICQRWAQINRKLIVNLIMDFIVGKGVVSFEEHFQSFESVHNYIGDDNIIRKGAISARLGERCIIPLNMRDGSLICIGKGNEDWNYSAPHGAGRMMSRTEAFNKISLSDFRDSMSGIYSETITEKTKDESPMVYKPKDEIIQNIFDSVDIETVIRPVFNFKAPE